MNTIRIIQGIRPLIGTAYARDDQSRGRKDRHAEREEAPKDEATPEPHHRVDITV